MQLIDVTNKHRLPIFQTLTSDLSANAHVFVTKLPIPSATPKDSSVELTWDNKFNYDFSNNQYFIHVYSNTLSENSIVTKIEINEAVYKITINNLENGKPYYFALFIIKKSDNTVTNSYSSEMVTPSSIKLNSSATPFTPATKQQGGGNYEQKYLKYKNKYLQLKKLKKIN
jgi:hypothetical protein